LSISSEKLVLIVGQVVVSLRIQVLALMGVIIKYHVAVIEEWTFEVGTRLIGRAEFL
jgi:hypothetical protein